MMSHLGLSPRSFSHHIDQSRLSALVATTARGSPSDPGVGVGVGGHILTIRIFYKCDIRRPLELEENIGG